MSKIDQRTQYEASMMSMTFILLGMIGMAIYTIGWTTIHWGYKLFIGVNAVSGFMFLFSNLVTTYQQYISFMDIQETIETLGGDENRGEKEKKGESVGQDSKDTPAFPPEFKI